MSGIKELIDKISSYNIFNYLFPGVLFASLGEKISGYSLIFNDAVVAVFLYYFYGLVISRIGSLVISPVLEKLKVIEFTSYDDYIAAEKYDAKIEILSEINNMYRTLLATFFCLLILKIYEIAASRSPSLDVYTLYILLVLLIVIFTYSYKKQTKYIYNRVKFVNKKPQGEKNETHGT